MADYDTVVMTNINGEDQTFQLKCWECSYASYRQGSQVPAVFNPVLRTNTVNYAIALREGGYLNVEDGVLTSWTPLPEQYPVFSKYGNYISSTDKFYGTLADPFSEESILPHAREFLDQLFVEEQADDYEPDPEIDDYLRVAGQNLWKDLVDRTGGASTEDPF